MPEFDPLLVIDKFRYADLVRTLKQRVPGSCITLKNTAPNQGEGERVRRGYAAYTAVTAPTGMQVLKNLAVQVPSEEDIHLWFASNSGQKVYQNPYWVNGVKQSSNILLGETLLLFDPANADVTINPHSIVVANAVTNGLSSTTDYYTGWIINKNGTTQYAQIKSYTVAAGTATFTVVETVGSGGYAWATSSVFNLYRNFHDNPGFSPTYNTDLANPIAAVTDNSELFFSGGQSSAAGNVGLTSRYQSRSYFPSDVLNTFSLLGTYACEERLKAPPALISSYGVGNLGNIALDTNNTYWLAFAFIYDNDQIGELRRYEDLTFYTSSGAWTRNYLAATVITDSVASVLMSAGGTNYVNVGVVFSGGGGSGATATANLSSGVIVSVNVTNSGSGYSSAPTISFTSGVASVTVGSGGSGYTNNQAVTFTGGGGSGALGLLVTSGGVITSVQMVSYGSGYTSAPTPVIGGGGSGASLTAVVGSGAAGTSSLSTASVTNQAIALTLSISPATMDKRVTGIAFYAAQDPGQTVTRKNEYFFIADIPIIASQGYGSGWTLGTDGKFSTSGTTILLDGAAWNAKGDVYAEGAGIEEIPTDTSYAYSQRVVVGEKEHRHIISNVYVGSEGIVDRQSIFTNPIGGEQGINSGIIARSMFSNELGFYRLNVQPTIGTKINDIKIVGLNELLILKDRGIILERILIDDNGIPELMPSILDHDAGCSTLQGSVAADDGFIYFAGYEDIYRYVNGQYGRLIERKDQQDWLYQYRQIIAKSDKESVSLAYLPEGIVLVDIAQTSGQQFAFYTQSFPDGWRQFAPALRFKYFAKLRNGTVLAVSTESTPAVYEFSNPSTGAYYYSDAGTAIKYEIDTGRFVPSGSVTRDTVFDRFQIARYFDSPTQGTLDAVLYRDGAAQRVYTGLDKTSVYQRINGYSDDPHIGNDWRLDINNNASPEILNAGSDLRILSIAMFGHLIPRERVSDASYGSGIIIGNDVTNTINGVNEILLSRTPQTFIWDKPFVKTYTSPNELISVPAYTVVPDETPFVLNGDRTQVPTITTHSRTLTTITMSASDDAVVFRFRATE